MILYSDTIKSFISRVKKYAKAIIAKEMRLKVSGDYFLFNGQWIRFSIVVFESDKEWGFFRPSFQQIGLNHSLMYMAKTEVIKNVLRHELAHFYMFLTHANAYTYTHGHNHRGPHDHGSEFRKVCHRFGWRKDVWAARGDVSRDNIRIEGDIPSERVIEKVKKLMALAESKNRHESELAMAKANQLLLQHNLQRLSQEELEEVRREESLTYVEDILKSKRLTAKMLAITDILETFYVNPIINRGNTKVVTIQIIGDKTNVELAAYVGAFLDRELERLWEENRKKWKQVSGVRGKKWFMMGVAQGYKEKIEQQIRPLVKTKGKEVMKIREDLDERTRQMYPRLGTHRTSMDNPDAFSNALGNEAGKNLSIHPGIVKKETGETFLPSP